MNYLYMLVGVPGSGKSSWANSQKWAKDCCHISTDKHIENWAGELGRDYTEIFSTFMPAAVELMTAEVIYARENKKDIIWDQTSTTVRSRSKKLTMLPDYYAIAVVFPTPDREELDARLKLRSGKVIPVDVIDNMIQGYEPPQLEEGFKEIWTWNETTRAPMFNQGHRHPILSFDIVKG